MSLEGTILEGESNLKDVSLTGKGIHISKSILSPSEFIEITAGGKKTHSSASKEETLPSSLCKGIIVDECTILRSKGIFLRSLEEQVPIRIAGLLHSTHDDIIIEAMGDIYINSLYAARNLFISTSGKVIFGNHAFVGGTVSIISDGEVVINHKLSLAGQLFVKASKHLSILGDITSQSEVKLEGQVLDFKGSLKTQGKMSVSGKQMTITGEISAEEGAFLNLEQLGNKGTLSAFGSGLQGKIKSFLNEGKADFSTINATIEESKNTKNGIIRTRGHSFLQGLHYFNEGNVFTCGVHSLSLTGSYKDSGTFYSPTFVFLNAQKIDYLPGHKSFIKSGIITANAFLGVEQDAEFNLQTQDKYFLHLISKGDLKYRGKLRQSSSASFPLLDYFTLFNTQTTSPSYKEFSQEIYSIPMRPWRESTKSLGTGVTLKAGRNIDCKNSLIDPTSGTVSFISEGRVDLNGAKIKSGYFSGNNASISSKIATLTDTQLTSLFGQTSIYGSQDIGCTNSSVQGREGVFLHSQSISMEESAIKSTHGVALAQATNGLFLSNSSVQGASLAAIQGREAFIRSLLLTSEKGSVSLKTSESAEVSQSTFTGTTTTLETGENLKLVDSNLASTNGATILSAGKEALLQNSSVLGKEHAGIYSDSIHMERSSLQSEQTATAQAKRKAVLDHSSVEGPSSASVNAHEVFLNLSQVQSSRGGASVEATQSAFIEKSKVKGETAFLTATRDLNMKKSQIEGSQSTSVFSHSLQMEDTTATSTQGVKPPKVGPFLAS